MSQEILLIVTVPPEDADALLDAIASAGGGTIGEYTHCAFMTAGDGRFKPSAAATPHTGVAERINREPEIRIETFCARADAKAIVAAIRAAHPYEEPVIYIVPLLNESEL